MDLAFWFTFAGYRLVPGAGPRRDLDLASYGVVKMAPGGPGLRLPGPRLGTQARIRGAGPGGLTQLSRREIGGRCTTLGVIPVPPPRYPLG